MLGIRFRVILALRVVLRSWADLDGYLVARVSRVLPSEYVVTGQCLQRGVCCRHIAIRLSGGFWRWPWLRAVVVGWYRYVYAFRPMGVSPEERVVVFACGYLQDNRCCIHRWRPMICRRYPQVRHFGKPTFLPGCGYVARRT